MPHPGLEIPPPEGQDLTLIKQTCRELQRYLPQKRGESEQLAMEIMQFQVDLAQKVPALTSDIYHDRNCFELMTLEEKGNMERELQFLKKKAKLFFQKN